MLIYVKYSSRKLTEQNRVRRDALFSLLFYVVKNNYVLSRVIKKKIVALLT